MEPRICIVLDIDGGLADAKHRRHFLESEPKDWKAFFKAAADDSPVPGMTELANAFADSGAKVIYWTGRPRWIEDITTAWLTRHGFPFVIEQAELLMRENNDRSPDAALKGKFYDWMVANNYRTVLVVDGRKEAAEFWEQRGITCLRNSKLDF